MRKRLLALLAIAAFVVAPTFASLSDTVDSAKKSVSIKTKETKEKLFDNTTHPTWAAGLSLGTNSGVQVNYRLDDKITLETVVGFGLFNKKVQLEEYAMYNATSFEVSELKFDVSAGLGANLGFTISSSTDISAAVVAVGEICYSFDDDLPLDLALRAGAGVNLDFTGSSVDPSLTVPVAITCVYRFI